MHEAIDASSDTGGMALQNILQKYQPRASIVPPKLDFTDCPYAWPFCRQPVYAGAMPLMFNATVLNGMGLTGVPVKPSHLLVLHSASRSPLAASLPGKLTSMHRDHQSIATNGATLVGLKHEPTT